MSKFLQGMEIEDLLLGIDLIVQVKLLDARANVPCYAHGPDEDAGADLVALDDVVLTSGVPTLVKTGLAIELPPGFEGQIRPRSGLALRHGLTIPNSPATIDPSYRGEVGVILQWFGYRPNASEWRFGESDDVKVVEVNTAEHDAMVASSLAQLPRSQRWHRTGKDCLLLSKRSAIAQMVVASYDRVRWDVCAELAESVRGERGYGSTDRKVEG